MFYLSDANMGGWGDGSRHTDNNTHTHFTKTQEHREKGINTETEFQSSRTWEAGGDGSRHTDNNTCMSY